jgi:hypothetical protein
VVDERRKFPRLKAPIYCRPARRRLPRRQIVDLGLGGMRVYSDEPFRIGERLEVDLYMPDGATVACLTEVVWQRELPGADPAPYDVGLQFLDVPPDTQHMIARLLTPE